MRVFVCVFLGVLACLDVAWGAKCDEVIKDIREEAFHIRDADNDNVVTPNDVDDLVAYMDDDDSGVISLEEIKAGLKVIFPNMHPIATQLFKEMAGTDGVLEGNELFNMMLEADVDGNSKITNQEDGNLWNSIFIRVFKAADLSPKNCTW